jgi:hypothetical protein
VYYKDHAETLLGVKITLTIIEIIIIYLVSILCGVFSFLFSPFFLVVLAA